jgi:hypothetical protein
MKRFGYADGGFIRQPIAGQADHGQQACRVCQWAHQSQRAGVADAVVVQTEPDQPCTHLGPIGCYYILVVHRAPGMI